MCVNVYNSQFDDTTFLVLLVLLILEHLAQGVTLPRALYQEIQWPALKRLPLLIYAGGF